MTQELAAQQILQLLQEEAVIQFPLFPEVFGLLPFKPAKLEIAALSSDGKYLFYNPDMVCRQFLTDSAFLRWMYLHTHLHAILGHFDRAPEFSDTSAYDIEIAFLAFLITRTKTNSDKKLFMPPPAVVDFFTHQMQTSLSYSFRLFSEFRLSLPEDVFIPYNLFITDSHEKWNIKDTAIQMSIESEAKVSSSSYTAGVHQNPLLNIESIKNKLLKCAKENESTQNGKRGSSAGDSIDYTPLQKRNAFDYSVYLRKFMIPREEAILDIDSFDCIPYHYGLTYYENLPFIEPLEYKEVNRLDELAIAIDTSGSCSGVVVRRFLEETWNILSQRENFFNKMRIHLIQCDCMVQEHRIFTSVEEWEEAVPTLQIHGHGDTDFQPVFTYLEKLIKKGEIRQLRGLLFFTDGDGIFPPVPPSFDTAFVFLNNETEKHAIPDWGIRLNLNLPDVF